MPTSLERKRAKDREFQRNHRVRTKAYVTQLENEIADLRKAGQGELGSTVESQFAELQKEHENLRKALEKIGRSAQEAVAQASNPASNVATASLTPDSIKLHQIHEADHDERLNHTEADNACHLVEYDPILTNEPGAMDDYQIKILHGLSPSDPAAASILSSFFQTSSQTEPNMFAQLDNMVKTLRRVYEKSSVIPINQSFDDDICIRAIIFGWDCVPLNSLDSIWTAIQALDRLVYKDCPLVERVAMIRLLRTLLVVRYKPTFACHVSSNDYRTWCREIGAIWWTSLRT